VGGGRGQGQAGRTESGVDVAQHPGGLHVDGVDVGDGLRGDAVLQQQLFDLLGLGQDRH